jgi:Zn-dependent oligopeptidase
MQWNHGAKDIESITSSSINNSRSIRDRIAALPVSQRNFSSVFLELAKEEAITENATGPLTFYQYVSTNEELRNAANTAEQRLNEYGIESSMRLDVFQALKDAKTHIDASGQKLAPEELRLVEKMLLDGKRNGLDLPEETREQLKIVSFHPTCVTYVSMLTVFITPSSRKISLIPVLSSLSALSLIKYHHVLTPIRVEKLQ